MRELKIGDVVVLKSGGPDMTIKEQVFSIESLELAEDE
jgi:uncharacterized protein YodC (DUF2158 family)